MAQKISPALLAANQKLLQLRSAKTSAAHKRENLERTADDLTAVQRLPEHLGWGSVPLTAALRAAQRSFPPMLDASGVPCVCVPETINSVVQPEPTIKLYPDLGLALLQRNLAGAGRLWLLLRHFDIAGCGSFRIAKTASTLTEKTSKYHLCGKRQLRNLFRQGDGIFWHRDKERIWLRSTAKVAVSLGLSRLTHRPVSLPVSALLGGVGDVKAHFYASFHSGRKSNPISRETLETVTGVPARTQRAYEERIGVQKQHNIAVGERYSDTAVQERAWVQGTAVFDFMDHLGQQGPARRHYVAWHLPNQYDGPHQRSARGRMRKTNRKLKDLVTNQARGNSGETVGRLFYADGAAAGRAYGRDTAVDRYWRRNPARECPTDLWFVFAKEVSD